jgi:hypothetical protein
MAAGAGSASRPDEHIFTETDALRFSVQSGVWAAHFASVFGVPGFVEACEKMREDVSDSVFARTHSDVAVSPNLKTKHLLSVIDEFSVFVDQVDVLPEVIDSAPPEDKTYLEGRIVELQMKM